MKLDRLVIGEDFSDPALAATRWAARHFAPDAELILVHAIEPATPPSYLEEEFPPAPALADDAREDSEHRLRDLADEIGRDRVRCVIREGRPERAIIDVAVEVRADLIVVGEFGHHGRRADVLGTTADWLTRAAPVPVLLSRRLRPSRPRRILLPIEESALLGEALGWGRFCAERFDAEILALYPLDPAGLERLRMVAAPEHRANIERDIVDRGAAWLRRKLENAGFGEGDVGIEVVVGDPVREILSAARRFDADLIIMAGRAAGPGGEAIIGSITRSVLRAAPGPVLVVNRSRPAHS